MSILLIFLFFISFLRLLVFLRFKLWYRVLDKICKWHLIPVVLCHEISIDFRSEFLVLCLDVLTFTIEGDLAVVFQA